MKKYFIVFVALFFSFNNCVFASSITNLKTEVVVHKDGSASFINVMEIQEQKDTNFTYAIFNAEDSKVKNLEFYDDLNTHFSETSSLESGKAFFYKFTDDGYKKFFKFQTVSQNAIYTLKFDLTNFVVKYSDGVYGLDYFPFSRVTGNNINILNVNITFEDSSIISKITKIKGIGGKNLVYKVNENSISIYSSTVDSGESIRLLVSFDKDVTFKTYSSRSQRFDEALDDIVNGRDFKYYFYAYSSKEFLIGFAVTIEVGIIILILSYIIIRYGTHDEYYGMEIQDKKKLTSVKEVPYYESVPCQGDVYKVFFVAGYFKLLKSKTDLLGAILFKMYLNDNIELLNGKNGMDIRLRNDMKIDRSLDQDLYNIFMEMSDMRIVSPSKSNKFAKENYMRLMTWYNMGYSETITDEMNRGHAVRGGKIGKTTKIIFNDVFVDYGNKIIGMKKYLLNFNQVARQTPLSEDTYKLLLICAQMLGIGEQVSTEILRKNPTNIYAKKLQEFQHCKYIYKDVYSIALSTYRQTVKNSEIYNYDKMKDGNLQSSTNVLSIKK